MAITSDLGERAAPYRQAEDVLVDTDAVMMPTSDLTYGIVGKA